MTSRAPLPESLPPFFSVAHARSLGVSRHRLNAADLRSDFHGARASLAASRRMALVPLMAPDQAFWGPTAAELWQLPLPLRYRAAPELYVSSSLGGRMRRPGVVPAQIRPLAIVTRDGAPVFDPVSTWMSLGRLLAPWDLTAVADSLVSGTLKTPPLSTLQHLSAAVADAAGTPGIRALRCALGNCRAGSWSRTETLLRLLIQAAELPEPQLNLALMLAGTRVFVDLAWPELRIAIEYDSREFHGDAQRAWDIERHELLVDAGWIVVRVRAQELFDQPSAVVERLVRRLALRGVSVPAIRSSQMPRFSR